MKLPWSKPQPSPVIQEVTFISIGMDCTPAIELRSLGLRKTAMPFDWLRSTATAIIHCIRTDFSGYHDNLRLDPDSQRVVDGLGLEFTHEYPTLESYENTARTLEGWEAYVPLINEKYHPRIQRFVGLMRSDLPVVILSTMSWSDIAQVREAMRDAYGRTNRVVFVSLNSEGFPSNHNTLWCASKDILPQRLQFAAQLATS
uniref:Peptidase n=1 Tax=viral metagenome TaxID=1070528 RepID=A0A6C0HK68_9ZZZZ